jgi:hypothetical protein
MGFIDGTDRLSRNVGNQLSTYQPHREVSFKPGNVMQVVAARYLLHIALQVDAYLSCRTARPYVAVGRDHIVKKRKQVELKIKEFSWLLGRKSQLSIANKLLIYKTIITPI